MKKSIGFLIVLIQIYSIYSNYNIYCIYCIYYIYYIYSIYLLSIISDKGATRLRRSLIPIILRRFLLIPGFG